MLSIASSFCIFSFFPLRLKLGIGRVAVGEMKLEVKAKMVNTKEVNLAWLELLLKFSANIV